MTARIRIGAAIAAAALLGSSGSAGATADAASVRLAGETRYTTAATVAISAWEDVNIAIVATGASFADALAANYLAGAIGSPILLTPRNEMQVQLPEVFAELSVSGVQLIGGDSAIADSVAAEIEAEGYQVSRLAGANRFETARAIAETLPPEAVGILGDFGPTAIIVNGYSYADALAAGPMSYAQGWPILLTNADRLEGNAGTAIENLGITNAIIVGGTSAVSEGVVADLAQLGVTNQRLAGNDRTETAAEVAQFSQGLLGYGADDVILARGDDFPDALAAGPRGGTELMPILLTASSTDLGAAAAAFITEHKDELARIEVFGGTAAISEGVENLAVTLARS